MELSHGFAGAMVELWRSRRTAILRVSAYQVNTTISILDGVPVWATGGGKSETLGRLCVRLGLIDEDQYERAILELAERDNAGAPARLGDVLLELGLLDGTQLQNALRTQIREKIIACFQWDAAELDVQPDTSGTIRSGNRSPWPVPALIAEGVVRHFDERRCDRVIEPELDRKARLFDSKETVATLLNLPAELLAPFERGGTLRQVCSSGLLTKQLTAALLMLGFLDVIRTEDLADQLCFPATMDLSFGASTDLPDVTGDVDLRSMIDSEYERIKGSSPEAYFGIRGNASPKEITTAFELQVRPFVQASLQGTSGNEQARLTEIYNAIAAVRDTLLERSSPKKLSAAPRKSGELDAEAAFLRGKQMLERGERKGAAEMFAQAVEKSPDTREYQMFRAYTDFLRAQTDWDRDKAFAETRKFAKEALEQDAKNGKAHLILGRLYRLEGKEEKAREEFELAVEASNDREAELELRVIERRIAKKAEKKSVFFWKKP